MSKRPKQSTRAGGPAVGTADSDFGEAVRVFHDASIAVWSDPVVWEEEALGSETRLLAWPQPDDRGTRVQRFFAQRFNEEVLTVVQLMTVRAAPAQPLDARDPRLQLVLRVVMRASQRGLAAVANEFAGTRLTGHGRWLKTIKEQLVDEARRGRTTAEALVEVGKLGISRSAFYRAEERTRRRK